MDLSTDKLVTVILRAVAGSRPAFPGNYCKSLAGVAQSIYLCTMYK
ncbi:MAG: hypothetical protein GQF41_1124 [Candidatus Rifleibacterium amylolyticum]|nr:MAG: hypothetical protein GQF41_1124 [Candidatus Rifleibacterium amylolyticum]